MTPLTFAIDFIRRYIYFSVLLLVLCCCPTPSYSNGIVAGEFLSSEGNKIVLQLAIQSESPVTIIVEQLFSAGNQITETNPDAKKISSNGKKIKWLLKKRQTEVLKLKTILANPIQGKVKAIIRYRSPQTGKFVETEISP